MLRHNFLTYSSQILLRLGGRILYFPVWWYSLGFWRLLKQGWLSWLDQEKSLGWSVWLKNIFVPMYGQRDWAGRLISFLVRLVQIVARGLMLLVWVILWLFLFLIWLGLPLFLLFALVWQLSR